MRLFMYVAGFIYQCTSLHRSSENSNSFHRSVAEPNENFMRQINSLHRDGYFGALGV